jgi:myo-inositol-1(or 4)-monophosphatase
VTGDGNRGLTDGDRHAFRDAAVDVAVRAGAHAFDLFTDRATLVVEQKGARDYVSAADRSTEALVVDELKRRFPDHAFFGEEGEKARPRAGQPVWVIDPIDGTTNFLRGIPMWAVSIGLVVDGTPEIGVLRLPCQRETYAAARGLGAVLDGAPIAVAKTSALASATVAVGSSNRTSNAAVDGLRARLNAAGVEIRRLGSACVEQAYVACGRLDGYVELHLNSWDVAAGIVILREAGGRTNAFDDGDWLTNGNPYVGGAPLLYDALRALALA